MDQRGDYPTHWSLLIEINTVELENVARRLQRPTSFAKLFEDKVQEETKKAEEEPRKPKRTMTTKSKELTNMQ